MRILFVILALALAGCQTTSAARVQCLPLKSYGADEQKALRDALDALPAGSPVRPVIADYLQMRDADRACLEAHP